MKAKTNWNVQANWPTLKVAVFINFRQKVTVMQKPTNLLQFLLIQKQLQSTKQLLVCHRLLYIWDKHYINCTRNWHLTRVIILHSGWFEWEMDPCMIFYRNIDLCTGRSAVWSKIWHMFTKKVSAGVFCIMKYLYHWRRLKLQIGT